VCQHALAVDGKYFDLDLGRHHAAGERQGGIVGQAGVLP